MIIFIILFWVLLVSCVIAMIYFWFEDEEKLFINTCLVFVFSFFSLVISFIFWDVWKFPEFCENNWWTFLEYSWVCNIDDILFDSKSDIEIYKKCPTCKYY